MLRPIFFILLILSLTSKTDLYGQEGKPIIGAKNAALGGHSTTLQDVFAVFNNPAGLSTLEGVNVGVYAENRFLVEDLNLLGVGITLPSKNGSFGLGGTYFGNAAYSESYFTLAYSRLLSQNLSIALDFDYVNLSIEEFGSTSAFTFGLGLQFSPSKNIDIGAHIHNPIRVSLIQDGSETMPSIIKIGLAYHPEGEGFTLFTEVEKDIDRSTILKFGLDYQLIEKLSLRAGISTNPAYSSFGLGLNLGSIMLDFANRFHPVLGYSPHISLIYQNKNTK
ncbi:MAG: hypothetical protein AB8B69_04495 [Chitinophagales bacterium]